ncbi:MAG: hypothetical protein AAF902_13840 [Chloroflexota bacterium]
MDTFGKRMSTIRRNCTDPHKGGSLSQDTLADLVSDRDFSLVISKSLISQWENNNRKISLKKRKLLIAIISVFAQCGGLTEIQEANKFLILGNHAPLKKDEIDQIPHSNFQSTKNGTQPKPDAQENLGLAAVLQLLNSQSEDIKKLRKIISEIETGRKEAVANISSTQRGILELISYQPMPVKSVFESIYENVDQEKKMRIKEINLRLHELRYLGLINRKRDENHKWLYWREIQRSLFLDVDE